MLKIITISTIIYNIVYHIVIAAQGDYYGTYSTYNSICFKRNLFAWLPTILIFLWFMGCLMLSNDFDIIAKSFFMIIGTAVLSCFASLHASRKNMDTGYSMGMENTERFNKEKNNETYGKATMIAGGVITAHHLKKKVKEFTNVDSWEEMK